MRDIVAMKEPNEGATTDNPLARHQGIAAAWIASAMEGIREMHQDELVRRRVVARSAKTDENTSTL